MKTDDFEQRFERQPLRRVPAGWRDEILTAAGAAERSHAATGSIPAWRLFCARFPVAWGAFAALWIVLVSVNALLAASDTPRGTRQIAASSFQSLAAWNHHRTALLQLAGDDPSMNADTPSPQSPAVNPKSPRSEHRRGWQLGEVFREPMRTV